MSGLACITVDKGSVGELGASLMFSHKNTSNISKMMVLRRAGSSLCPNTDVIATFSVDGKPVASGSLVSSPAIQSELQPGETLTAVAILVDLNNGIVCIRLGNLDLVLDECDLVTLNADGTHAAVRSTEVEIPSCLWGSITGAPEAGICMDGATHQLRGGPRELVRLKGRTKEITKRLDELVDAKVIVTVCGVWVPGPECDHLSVYSIEVGRTINDVMKALTFDNEDRPYPGDDLPQIPRFPLPRPVEPLPIPGLPNLPIKNFTICKKATVNAAHAYYQKDSLLIIVHCTVPQACWKIDIEPDLLTVEPPGFIVKQCKYVGAACAEVVQERLYAESFQIGVRHPKIRLIDADGTKEIDVVDFR